MPKTRSPERLHQRLITILIFASAGNTVVLVSLLTYILSIEPKPSNYQLFAVIFTASTTIATFPTTLMLTHSMRRARRAILGWQKKARRLAIITLASWAATFILWVTYDLSGNLDSHKLADISTLITYLVGNPFVILATSAAGGVIEAANRQDKTDRAAATPV